MKLPGGDARAFRNSMALARNTVARAAKARMEFLKTDLDMCFTLLSLADTESKMGDKPGAEQALANAAKGYATLARFLSNPTHVKNLPEEEVCQLNQRLERLKSELDRSRSAIFSSEPPWQA